LVTEDQDDPPDKDTYILRITLRCLTEDLGLSREDVDKSIADLSPDICRAFAKERSQNPIGTKKIQPLTTNLPVYRLAYGERIRGGTWHDRDLGVVWLLGAGWHTSGDDDDVFNKIKDLDAEGRLFPTDEDRDLAVQATAWDFARALLEEAPRILAEGRSRPGEEIRAMLAGIVPLSLVVDHANGGEAIYLAVTMNLALREEDMRPPGEWLAMLPPAFFPWVADRELDVAITDAFPTRGRRPNEVVYYCLGDG
jgi:hypothetical protein